MTFNDSIGNSTYRTVLQKIHILIAMNYLHKKIQDRPGVAEFNYLNIHLF